MAGAFLFWWPRVAENEQTNAKASTNKSEQHQQLVPPTHVVIDPPFPTSDNHRAGAPDGQNEAAEKPLPRFERPEWVIVYVTIAYVLIATLTMRVIKKQANTMEIQARDARASAAASALTAQETLAAIRRLWRY